MLAAVPLATSTPLWATIAIAIAGGIATLTGGFFTYRANRQANAAMQFQESAGAMTKWQVHKRSLIGPYVAVGRALSRDRGDDAAFHGLHAEVLANAYMRTREFLDDTGLPENAKELFADEGKTRQVIDRLGEDARRGGPAD